MRSAIRARTSTSSRPSRRSGARSSRSERPCAIRPRPRELRWAFEELRVAIFAPELKTPVSRLAAEGRGRAVGVALNVWSRSRSLPSILHRGLALDDVDRVVGAHSLEGGDGVVRVGPAFERASRAGAALRSLLSCSRSRQRRRRRARGRSARATAVSVERSENVVASSGTV